MSTAERTLPLIDPDITGEDSPLTVPTISLPQLEYEGRRITTIITMPILSRDIVDIGRPGVLVEVDPDVAEQMGAFPETALSAVIDGIEGNDDGE